MLASGLGAILVMLADAESWQMMKHWRRSKGEEVRRNGLEEWLVNEIMYYE